ncbi:chemotaxis protein CheW [Thermosynechococcaceae cyanobacterium Okahandja]
MNYLTLRSQGLSCVLPLSVVQELINLPELTLVPETPVDIIGIMNVRGELVPVMHLGCRLGIAHPQCHATDVVILVEALGLRLGVVVNQVEDVVNIDPSELLEEPDYGHLGGVNTAFVAGLATVQDELAIVINVETLIREPAAVAEFTVSLRSPDLEASPQYDFYARYWPAATPAQKALLKERQQRLSQDQEDAEALDQQLSVGVFELGGEQFAVPLTEIRQFIDLGNVVPIPGAPPFIIGHLPLQGEVIPLVDVREPLRVKTSAIPLKKAIVVYVNSITIAILIQGIQDIMTYHYQQLQLSSFLSVHDNGHVGSIIQEGKVIKLLNLKQLFSKMVPSFAAA